MLLRIVQSDRLKPRPFLVPVGTFLHVEEQVHRPVQQASKLLPRSRPDFPHPASPVADQDRLVPRRAT